MKNLAIFDMDGTLFDTRVTNFESYKTALEEEGYTIDYQTFQKFCYGRYYKEFLADIAEGITADTMEHVHSRKKAIYREYIKHSVCNEPLFFLIRHIRESYFIALVTTASNENVADILTHFQKQNEFDLIIGHDEVKNNKPDPEGYILAMKHFGVTSANTIIFEDSDTGIEAAISSGAQVFRIVNFIK
jgi:beta-phosphoglucomutase